MPAMPLRKAVLLCALAGLLGACASQPHNSVRNIGEVDRLTLEKMTAQVAEESRKLAANHADLRQQIEQVQPAPALEAVAPAYDPLENKVVSIRMYEANAGQLLWAMADQLGMNLMMAPEVNALQQRATLNLKDVTAREVFRGILDVFDLHGEVRGNTLTVGLMQEKVIELDFLNTRMSVDISSGGNVFGSGGSGGGSSGGSGGGGSDALRGNFSLSGGSGDERSVFQQIDAAIQQVLGLEGGSAKGGEDKDKGKPGEGRGAGNARTRYTLNALTGSLYINARPSQVSAVDKVVRHYKSVLRRQVLIEAQLLDVELSDGFEFGVDWNLLRRYVSANYGSGAISLPSQTSAFPGVEKLPLPTQITLPGLSAGGTGTGSAGGLIFARDSFAMAVNMLRSFGNVRVLSNPSIRARNGTPALLSVGTNTRYVSKSTVTVTNPGGGASTTSADVTTDSLFAGVIVGVVPYIRDEGTVEVLVHPMQTDVDPASLALVEVAKTGDGSSKVTLPVINFKGMTTTLSLRDGDTVLLGGLIDQKTGGANRGIPGAADVPGVGRLFGEETNNHRSREMIMVLRVRVL